jgi:hypothetical protein
MSNETTMTITGNLTSDPELRYTPAGQPVARFRVVGSAYPSRVPFGTGTGAGGVDGIGYWPSWTREPLGRVSACAAPAPKDKAARLAVAMAAPRTAASRCPLGRRPPHRGLGRPAGTMQLIDRHADHRAGNRVLPLPLQQDAHPGRIRTGRLSRLGP